MESADISDAGMSSQPGTSTPKQRKKHSDQNSQRKGRKTSQTHAAAPAATPMKKQEYYAGPAFANSPAPSSLPIPKFFLKQEAARVSSSEESPSSVRASPAIGEVTKGMSGIDLLFSADRKEKASRHTPQPSDSRPSSGASSRPPVPHSDQDLEEQSRQLKNLLAGKPSTPTQQLRPLQQHMSAPPQYSSSQPYDQQPDYYYGNRHLSPMFEAARQTPPSNNPHGPQNGYHPSHYRVPSAERFPQYSPNPPKTALYQQTTPVQRQVAPDLDRQQSSGTPSKAQKEDAIRRMIGMN